MKKLIGLALLIAVVACEPRNKYAVDSYHTVMEQDSVLAGIIAHVYTAPPYTSMRDRFKPEHRSFYVALTPKFAFEKYFVADNGLHYFYVIRPASKIGEKRGVGGYFRIDDQYHISGFREIYVTPILPDAELKTRGGFLFDQMVKGEIQDYLKMPSYVQYPNAITAYDTTSYEWRLIEN